MTIDFTPFFPQFAFWAMVGIAVGLPFALLGQPLGKSKRPKKRRK